MLVYSVPEPVRGTYEITFESHEADMLDAAEAQWEQEQEARHLVACTYTGGSYQDQVAKAYHAAVRAGNPSSFQLGR